MSETLKPCPFCGGEPEVFGEALMETIFCKKRCFSIMGVALPKGEIYRRWNTRDDDNRWRSVAEQQNKAFADLLDDMIQRATELAEYNGATGVEIPVGNGVLFEARKALSAIDSLRREGL